MSRADLLRAELAVAELEEAYAAAKPVRERCPTCGRRKRVAADPKVDELKNELREARAAYRALREAE